MTAGNAPMPSTRRRAIPGMASSPAVAPPAPDTAPEPAPSLADAPLPTPAATLNSVAALRPREPSAERTDARRAATDYGSTRLVNFRIPVDLHDRYKRLVRDVEDRHPRLRHPSLTEVLIGLLEEGPDSPDQIAAVIRRKRAAEHGTEDAA